MTDAGFFRGTNSEQDTRFSDKSKKLLRTLKFDDVLLEKVDMKKVKLDTIKPWIAQRVTELLNMEDEVVVEYVFTQLEATVVDPKSMQINLTGFLNGKNAREFMRELWELLISAQANPSGIPERFLEAKKKELREREVEHDKVSAAIKKATGSIGLITQTPKDPAVPAPKVEPTNGRQEEPKKSPVNRPRRSSPLRRSPQRSFRRSRSRSPVRKGRRSVSREARRPDYRDGRPPMQQDNRRNRSRSRSRQKSPPPKRFQRRDSPPRKPSPVRQRDEVKPARRKPSSSSSSSPGTPVNRRPLPRRNPSPARNARRSKSGSSSSSRSDPDLRKKEKSVSPVVQRKVLRKSVSPIVPRKTLRKSSSPVVPRKIQRKSSSDSSADRSDKKRVIDRKKSLSPAPRNDKRGRKSVSPAPQRDRGGRRSRSPVNRNYNKGRFDRPNARQRSVSPPPYQRPRRDNRSGSPANGKARFNKSRSRSRSRERNRLSTERSKFARVADRSRSPLPTRDKWVEKRPLSSQPAVKEQSDKPQKPSDIQERLRALAEANSSSIQKDVKRLASNEKVDPPLMKAVLQVVDSGEESDNEAKPTKEAKKEKKRKHKDKKHKKEKKHKKHRKDKKNAKKPASSEEKEKEVVTVDVEEKLRARALDSMRKAKDRRSSS